MSGFLQSGKIREEVVIFGKSQGMSGNFIKSHGK